MIITLERGEDLEIRFSDKRDQYDQPSPADGKLVVSYGKDGERIVVRASDPDQEGRVGVIYDERGADVADTDAAPVSAKETKVLERIKAIIVEHLGYPYGIEPTSSFMDDLGADSLDTVELVMAFENEWGVEIPDDEVDRIVTVGDAVKLIVNRI